MRSVRKPQQILKAVHKTYGAAVPQGYDEAFVRAFLTFQHQRIYNTETERVEMLHDCNLSEWTWRTLRPHVPLNQMVALDVGETDFLGREVDSSLGSRIAGESVRRVRGAKLQVDWAQY